MFARASLSGFLLAFVLLGSGCSKDELAKSTMHEVIELTDDIVETVSEAEDKRAGVAAAQTQLDAAEAELGPKMKAVMELRGFQVSEETKSAVEAQRLDVRMKMITLETDLMIATMSDPELAAAVAKLKADHQALTGTE